MILYRSPLPSLSANKGVNQQVMRFTPFVTPKKFLGISCMIYCGTMSGILFLRIIQSYQNKTIINYYTIALGRNKTSHQRVGFSWSSTSLNATAGRQKRVIQATQCVSTSSTSSSVKGFAGKQRLMSLFQPQQQSRPYSCHPVGRSVKRTQRIPQGQVRRETRRIRRRPLRAPHRRLRRIRHPLHQLREIPRP